MAKVWDSKMKSAVMSKGKELKGSHQAITDQFPLEILRRRRLLYPAMLEARKNKKNARLAVDKLIIDGKIFRDPSVTYWLCGGSGKVNIMPES